MIEQVHSQAGLNKILIVDDDRTDVRYLNHLLEQPHVSKRLDPYEIKHAETASNGLETWQTWSPDCILLDYKLPDMTGLQFMEKINTDASSDPMAVIMLTGFGDESTAVQAMKLGVSDYLVKGNFTGTELTQIMHQAFEKEELLFELKQRREELALFADRLAHDMVTPLHSLGLHVELLDEMLANYDRDPLVTQNLRTIDSIISQISHFVQHLYDYTTVGRSNILFEPINLNDVIQHTLTLLKPELQKNEPNIQFSDLPVVKGSYIDLVQLVQNILSNAMKYTDKSRPQIEISAQRVNVDFWQITISDNGMGIAQQEQGVIFEPFKRATAARSYTGSGLGLSTCRKIVESHNGKIWVDSEIGRGTAVHFSLLAHTVPPAFPRSL